MSNSFKSIVRKSADILIEIEFEDDRTNHDEIYSEHFSATTTVDELIEQILTKYHLEHVPRNQIYLIRISHSNQRFPFPFDYRHLNLTQLNVDEEYRLHFRRPNWTLPVDICEIKIWGPEFDGYQWSWDRNSSTLKMLIDDVIEHFSLKDIDKTRIHLFWNNEEINLSLHPETLIAQIGIDKYSSIRVQIIPPLSPMTYLFDDQTIVNCFYLDKELTFKVSTFNTFIELEEKIENKLSNYRLLNIEMFDGNGERISITNSQYSLAMLGIQRGDRIVAHLQVESLSSISSDDQQFDQQVAVTFSPHRYSSNRFYISINETMGHLIRTIDNTTKCSSNRKLRIRCQDNDLDQTKTDQRLIDFGVNGKHWIHVTISYLSQIQTWTTNSLYSAPTRTMTTTMMMDDETTSKPIGLSNIGNTCFMNSALQCLVHVKPLTDFFLNSNSQINSNEKHFDGDQPLTNAYADLLKHIASKTTNSSSSSSLLFSSSWNSFDPRRIKEIIGNLAPRFATYEQQDAQEFMTFFLDRLHQEFRDSTQMDQQSKKIIKHLFYGKLHSIITCLKCQNQYTTTNLFNLLCLPLNEYERIFSIKFIGRDGFDETTVVQISSRSSIKHLIRNFERQKYTKLYRSITVMANDDTLDYETPLKDVTTSELTLVEQDYYRPLNSSTYFDQMKIKIRLDECFEEFFHDEHLDDPIECEEYCRERTAAKKQFQLDSLPPIVIIQLKRFSHENGYKSKIESFVDYPIKNLDLNRFVRSTSTSTSRRNEENGNYVYDLFAVSNHIGSIHFGHYTAFARRGDEWFKFSDSFVSKVINESDIVSQEAYLLFYMKRDAEETISD